MKDNQGSSSSKLHRRRGKKQICPQKPNNDNKNKTIKNQVYQQKRKGKTIKEQKLELAILSLLFIVVFYVLISAYLKYGIRIFIGHAYFDLKLTHKEWRSKIDNNNKTIFLIGGQHRAGTTVLANILSLHKDISGLGGSVSDSKNTGVDYNEGILMQDVYSRFGVGTEHLINNRKNIFGSKQEQEIMMGLGKYALNDEMSVHLTENNHRDMLSSKENMAKLLNRFGSHWDLQKSVWMEKSPPNAVISRFLDTLYNLPIDDGDNTTNTIASSSSSSLSYSITSKNKNNYKKCTKFLFMTRHPLANALAIDKMLGEGVVNFDTILQNYFRIHDYIQQDSIKLRNKPYSLLKLEDLTHDPKNTLHEIFKWLDIDSSENVIDDILNKDITILKDPNEKYRKKWCDDIALDEKKRIWAKGVYMKYQPLSDYYKLGYDLEGWCDDD